MRALIAIVLCTGLAATTAAAGTLTDVLKTDDANLYFSFETKTGVWGDGESTDIRVGGESYYQGTWSGSRRRQMTEGPGRVWIRIRDGKVRDLDLEVGGPDPQPRSGMTDLGFVAVDEVREAMLTLAETSDGQNLDDAILCAIVTDGFTGYDRLLAIARDPERPDSARKSAIFWLGQEASTVATEGLEQIVDDDNVELGLREHAIFALSQQGVDQAFGPLRDVVLESHHPQLREKALFWLAQYDDPRVIDLIEKILLR